MSTDTSPWSAFSYFDFPSPGLDDGRDDYNHIAPIAASKTGWLSLQTQCSQDPFDTDEECGDERSPEQNRDMRSPETNRRPKRKIHEQDGDDRTIHCSEEEEMRTGRNKRLKLDADHNTTAILTSLPDDLDDVDQFIFSRRESINKKEEPEEIVLTSDLEDQDCSNALKNKVEPLEDVTLILPPESVTQEEQKGMHLKISEEEEEEEQEVLPSPSIKSPQKKRRVEDSSASESSSTTEEEEEEETCSMAPTFPTHSYPPKCKKILSGFSFLLTSFGAKNLDLFQTAEDVPQEEDGIELRELSDLIKMNGGRTMDTLSPEAGTVKKKEIYKGIPNLLCIAPCGTLSTKYVSSLAYGVPPIHYQWILQCVSENRIVSLNDFLLPSGRNLFGQQLFMKSTSIFGKKSIFEGARIEVSGDAQFQIQWERIAKAGGAKCVRRLFTDQESSIDFVLTHEPLVKVVIAKTAQCHIPLVNKQWILQCLFEGKKVAPKNDPSLSTIT